MAAMRDLGTDCIPDRETEQKNQANLNEGNHGGVHNCLLIFSRVDGLGAAGKSQKRCGCEGGPPWGLDETFTLERTFFVFVLLLAAMINLTTVLSSPLNIAIALLIGIVLLIGFAVGYGVREIISRRRHREAARRREMAGPFY